MAAGDWQDALLAALRTAVKRRMVADVPVGVLLSGGIDSSLIVALLAESGPERPQDLQHRLRGRRGRARRRVRVLGPRGQRFGTDHRQIRVETEPPPGASTSAIAAMSEPMVSHDCVAFYLLSQEVSST